MAKRKRNNRNNFGFVQLEDLSKAIEQKEAEEKEKIEEVVDETTNNTPDVVEETTEEIAQEVEQEESETTETETETTEEVEQEEEEVEQEDAPEEVSEPDEEAEEEDEIITVEEEEEVKETETAEANDTILVIGEEKSEIHKSNKPKREYLSEEKFIQKFANKVCHLLFTIDNLLEYGRKDGGPNRFHEFRAKIDQIIETKVAGYPLFADTKIIKDECRQVIVYVIPEEGWKPVMKSGKCTNIPDDADSVTFEFHINDKQSGAATARDFFIRLARSRPNKIGGFLKHFHTEKMREFDIKHSLGKIEGFKVRNKITTVDEAAEVKQKA